MSAPSIIDGIACYAPQLARRNEGFPPGRFERLLKAEQNNFWYRSRSRILLRLVRRHLTRRPARFLEIGCGTGSQLLALSKEPGLKLAGAESYLEGLKFLRARLPQAELFQLDAARMPFEAEFDAAGLFDVLEHVEDDVAVLKGARRALRPGGRLFVTVPQHPFLWSVNDEAAFHKRRYTRGELRYKLEASGFAPVYFGSFVTALLPLLWMSRKLKGRRPAAADPYQAVLEELELPDTLNSLLELVMRLDEAAIAAGLSLPAGGSLCAVAAAR